MAITLKPVDEVHDRYGILYRLLIERPEYANISHAKIPTLEQHINFVNNNGYTTWRFILNEELHIVGSIYLTKNGEIGVAILKEWQRHGYATAAIKAIMADYASYRTVFFANISPRNPGSIELFNKIGFELIQHTYRFTA